MGRGMSEQCRRAASAPEGGAYLENILAHHPARSLGQVSQVEALQCFRPAEVELLACSYSRLAASHPIVLYILWSG